MATSADTAQEWLENSKPTFEQITVVIKKLESRISSAAESEANLQGSIDALELLNQVLIENSLDSEDAPEFQETDYKLAVDASVNLDYTALGDEPTAIIESLTPEQKRQRFLQLKNSIK